MKHLCYLFLVFTVCHVFEAKEYKRTYFENGNIESEGWTENNKKTLFWKFYYKNGVLKKQGHYLDDLETKYWKFYAKNGNLEQEGHFKAGKKNDWWLFYDSMQNVNHKCQLKNNQKNGYCLMYKNKKIIAAAKYKSGKKLKEWTTFTSFKKENKLSDLK